MLSLLFVAVFTACGLFLADWVLYRQPLLRRIWLGLVFGLFLWTWLPSLFSFVLGFNLLSNLLAAGVAFVLLIIVVFCNKHRFAHARVRSNTVRNLLFLTPILFIGIYLLNTHVLLPVNGDWYVGQTTYGDLAMHLGFISGIAKQGVFPPEYSIFPGHTVNYPFLCETSSASLVVLGLDLRTAYLVPAVYAFVSVVLGVYFFFEQWLKRRNRALLATFLFFVGGGFGFIYFLDLAGNGYTALSTAASDMQAGTSLQYLLDGFYCTPTNLPALGLRWVNPIVDMLIPQRATLFGWAFLFPCLYLLYGFVFKKEKGNILPLAVLAGGLPLIHTHSYVALAIVSAGYFATDLVGNRKKERLVSWLIYGGIAGVLGIFQLIPFAFAQAAESGMLKLHFNWCNTSDSFLWFYVKNLGLLALFTPLAFLLLGKQTRKVCVGPLLLWAVAECVVFQPNTYDNNKLLFICFLFACGLVARFLCCEWTRADRTIRARYSYASQDRALCGCLLLTCGVSFAVMLIALLRSESGFSTLKWQTLGSLLLLTLLALTFAVYRCYRADGWKRVTAIVQTFLLFVTECLLVLSALLQYTAAVVQFSQVHAVFIVLAFFVCLSTALLSMLKENGAEQTAPAWSRAALQTGVCLLAVCLFLSGVMTIMRELKSRYMAFDRNQIAVAAYIDENLETDAVFLTDYSWHLNPVSVLTGRSIVCGPGLYLFYHGIDTTERQADVTAMFERPEESAELFEKYNVAYVYIGVSERSNYRIDTAFFASVGEIVYDQGGITIYRIV